MMLLQIKKYVYAHVNTALNKKNAVFWDVAPCGFILNQSFGGMCRSHLHGRRNITSEEKRYGGD
jgi:hypothetical protein